MEATFIQQMSEVSTPYHNLTILGYKTYKKKIPCKIISKNIKALVWHIPYTHEKKPIRSVRNSKNSKKLQYPGCVSVHTP